MTLVTHVPAINNTNNNNIKEDLAWIQKDSDESDHAFSHVTITILRLKSDDESDLDDCIKYHHNTFLQDIIISSPHDIRLHNNHEKLGVTNILPQLVVM